MTTLSAERSLTDLETVIQRGLSTFVDVGLALLEIRDRRLYRESHGDFDAYCRERWGMRRELADQHIRSAQTVNAIALTGEALPSNEAQARELAPLLAQPVTLGEAWRDAVEKHGDRVTAAAVREEVRRRLDPQPLMNILADSAAPTFAEQLDGPELEDEPSPAYSTAAFIADQVAAGVDVKDAVDYALAAEAEEATAGPVAVEPAVIIPPDRLAPLMTSDSPEWYTPAHIVERVVRCLGAIDLDPCADPERRIPAEGHYTAADDGLSLPWLGRVYMNPPYGRGIDAWIERLVDAHERGDVTSAVALVPARTDTDWWERLSAFPVCFIHGRLKFSEHENSAPFPSAAVYLGGAEADFFEAFNDLGAIYERVTW